MPSWSIWVFLRNTKCSEILTLWISCALVFEISTSPQHAASVASYQVNIGLSLRRGSLLRQDARPTGMELWEDLLALLEFDCRGFSAKSWGSWNLPRALRVYPLHSHDGRLGTVHGKNSVTFMDDRVGGAWLDHYFSNTGLQSQWWNYPAKRIWFISRSCQVGRIGFFPP